MPLSVWDANFDDLLFIYFRSLISVFISYNKIILQIIYLLITT